MSSSVVYAIVRFGITSSAGYYKPNGEFQQAFPHKRIYRDKTEWAQAWHIFGDEAIVMYVLPQRARCPS